MLISKHMNDSINAQVGREFGASLQYISIASYLHAEALTQFADFFFKQAEEERDHAMKFVKYLVDAGAEVQIPPVDAPKAAFASVEEAIALSLQWEQDVTGYINALMDVAMEEKDYLTRQFLDWFVNEQLEEVSTMDNLLKVVQKAGDRNLLMLEAYISHLRE
jgi:ferritin